MLKNRVAISGKVDQPLPLDGVFLMHDYTRQKATFKLKPT